MVFDEKIMGFAVPVLKCRLSLAHKIFKLDNYALFQGAEFISMEFVERSKPRCVDSAIGS